MGEKDSLKSYREKRNFRKTPEPSGRPGRPSEKPVFVIQKHNASSLHYDFRLEIDGVLKSWAVPKGPSTDPRQKRLAVPTEDHPLEYAHFEGVIPEGEYGGGTVMVWDQGTYENMRKKKKGDRVSMAESVDEGKVEVNLAGKKIRGGYALFRTGRKEDKWWLLVKMKDGQADARRNPTGTQNKSVVSGRTLEEIARKEKERKSNR
jgi:DNA ligase D-like protein (predicted 3'-phosphoesterase)